MARVVEHKVYSKTDLEANNNKFWEVWLYDDGSIETRNGRQGAMGQRRFITATGRKAYETKIGKKEDKGYIENKVIEGSGSMAVTATTVANSEIKDIAKKQIKHSNPIVQKLIDFLVTVNAHQILQATGGQIIYDTSTCQFKTAVGVISPDQVMRARNLLSDLSDYVANDDFGDWDFKEKLNEYLSLVPRDFGRQRLEPRDILPSLSKVQQENSLLDGLDASFAGLQTAKPKKTTKKKDKKTPKIFDVKLTIIEDKKTTSHIRNLYQKTRKSMHQSNNLSIKTIYKVDIVSMRTAFEKYGTTIDNIKKLWHGTKASNLLSILRQGLVIPPSSSSYCTGRMYGNGIYFSDVSTKALNYATSYWGSGGDTSRTFMFLADVAMGKEYIPSSSSGGPFPRHGYHSTFAKEHRSGVYNNEMIVYRLDQANLIYLVEFCPRSRY